MMQLLMMVLTITRSIVMMVTLQLHSVLMTIMLVPRGAVPV